MNWTIKQLKWELTENLKLCTTKSEKLMCHAIMCKEIKKLSYELATIRNLTPAEDAILGSIGIRL